MKKGLYISAIVLFIATIVLHPQQVKAQGYSLGPIEVQGSIGFSSELYGVSGIQSRRPGSSGRIFMNASAEGLGFRYGVNLNLSTEQTTFRQDLNQLGLNFGYEWFSFSAGDVRPVFSQYSINGVNIRGGLIEAEPGNFLFTAGGGRVQRAIRPTEDRPNITPVFDQWMYAGKVGYSYSSSHYIHFIGTYARDAQSSLSQALRSDFDLSPAENATISTEFGSGFLDNRLNLSGTVTWAAHTGDLRRSVTDAGNLPYIFSLVMDERNGTFDNYAGSLNLRYGVTDYSIETSYNRIQPGFISFGLPFLRNDQEQIRIRPQFFLKDRRVRLSLDLGQTRNNLAGNLLETNMRHQAGLDTQTRFSDNFTLSAGYRLFLNRLLPEQDASQVQMRQVTHNITVAPGYRWESSGADHNLMISGNLQLFDMERRDANGMIGNNYTNFTTTTNYDMRLQSGLSVRPGVTWLMNRSDNSEIDSWRSNLSVNRNFLENVLNIGITGSYTHNTTRFSGLADRPDMRTEQISVNINAGYRLPVLDDYLRFNLRILRNNTDTGPGFSEVQATLQLNHRF